MHHCTVTLQAGGDYCGHQGSVMAGVRAGSAQSTSAKHSAQAQCNNAPWRQEVLVRRDSEFLFEDAIYCGRNWTVCARRSLENPTVSGQNF